MTTFWQDLRYAGRMLMKTPGFTLVAVITLALGIGANTAIFSVFDAVLLKPLPFDDPDRLFIVSEKPPNGLRNSVSAATFLDWQKQNRVFTEMAAVNEATSNFNLSGTDQAEKVTALAVTANYFNVLGVQPALGRTFHSDEDQPEQHPTVVLTHKLWQRLGGDPKLVGNSLELDGEKCTVIGVLKSNSSFERASTQLYLPLSLHKNRSDRRDHFLRVYARLKPGVSREQMQMDMDSVAAAIAEQSPETNKGWGVTIDSLGERVARPVLRDTVRALFGAVLFILLIACANVANLVLMRTAGRYNEISIRAAVGASRWRIVRQFLTESVLLALVGGVAGIALGAWLIGLFTTLMPPLTLPAEAHITLDGRVLIFAFGLTLLTGLLVGLIPARQAAKPILTEALKEGRQSSAVGSGHLSKLFIVAEIALALVLLTGAGLLVRNLLELRKTNLGFQPTNLLTLRISLPESKYKTQEHIVNYFEETLRRTTALPNVDRVSLATDLPLTGWSYGEAISIEGHAATTEAQYIPAHYQRVSPDYFRTLGIPVVKGRAFTAQDNSSVLPVLIINETVARRFFPNGDPIGKRIVLTSRNLALQIVGVAANVHVYGLGDRRPQENLEIYVPFAQDAASTSYVAIQTTGAPTQIANAVRREIQAVDKTQAVGEVKTMEEVVDQTLADKKFNTLLITSFAAIAVILAAVGIYGVISYAVVQHTREIGIRMALGAQTSDVLKLILGQGMLPVALGIGIGLAGAFAVTRLIASLLYAVTATDRTTFITTPVVMALTAFVACLIPARRATKVDPIVALRHE